MKLKPPKDARQLLDMYYLDMRSHLLEVAAAFDRLEAAGGCDDERLAKLRQAGEIAIGMETDRARRFLELLSV
jgi:hypothetical protein